MIRIRMSLQCWRGRLRWEGRWFECWVQHCHRVTILPLSALLTHLIATGGEDDHDDDVTLWIDDIDEQNLSWRYQPRENNVFGLNKEQPAAVIVTCARNAHQPDLSFVALAALQNGRWWAPKLVSLESLLLRRITFCAQRSSNVRPGPLIWPNGGDTLMAAE